MDIFHGKLNGGISFNIGPIDTELENIANLNELFLTMWILCCLSHNKQTRTQPLSGSKQGNKILCADAKIIVTTHFIITYSSSLLVSSLCVMGRRKARVLERPLFSPPITPCSRRARYAKTTRDESGLAVKGWRNQPNSASCWWCLKFSYLLWLMSLTGEN